MAPGGSVEYGEAVTEFEEFFSEKYYDKVSKAVQNGEDSIVVDFEDMDIFEPRLSDYLREEPDSALNAAEEGVLGVDIVSDEDFRVRFTNMPEEDYVLVRNLRSQHIGKYIPIEGMIKRASQVKPEVVSAIFECAQCGDRYEKEQDSSELKSPYKCDCGSRKFEATEKKMTDTQNITVEENPESREGSEQPSTIQIRLEGDLVDPDFQKRVVPGNVAEITGVIKERPLKKNSKKFDIYMEGNYLQPTQQEFEELELNEEEIEEIEEMSKDPEIFDKIARSIAPSIYGHHQIKKAIALQIFGGVKKSREDGVKSRGDIHMLLIGEPGTGKCVAPDTEILTSEGKKHKIGTLIDQRLENSDNVKDIDDGVYIEDELDTLGLDSQGLMEKKESSKLWKRDAPEKMYRIETASGRELEVTPSHPLFIQKHGVLDAVKAEELKEGSFIAAPRKIEFESSDELEIDYRKSKSNNPVRLNAPERLEPGFCRFLGYLVGEGYIQERDNQATIYLTNSDVAILEDVEEQLDKLGVNYTRRSPNKEKKAQEVNCSSSEFVSFLKEMAPSCMEKSRKRKLPAPVFSSSKPNVKNFIKAFVDAEGTVSTKEREINVGSTSKDLLKDLKTSLLRFGINSQLKPREDSYRLRISGKDFVKYSDKIGFVTQRKSERTKAFNSEGNTNTDVVPNLGEKLRAIRENLGMTQFDFSISRGAYQHYERLDRNPSISHLEKVVESFETRLKNLKEMHLQLEEADWNTVKQIRKEIGLSQEKLARETSGSQSLIGRYERGDYSKNNELLEEASDVLIREIKKMQNVETEVEKLKDLTSSDVFWDKIETIKKVEPDYEYVYDLEIPKKHNYLTEGVISHNSQMLKFTGQLAPKGRYVVGKSSTGAGLCVTGDTLIHTNKGFREIGDIGREKIPFETDTETAVEHREEIYTYGDRKIGTNSSRLAWRMPEKDCVNIETVYGKEIQASENTDILTCGENGIEWKKISEIDKGEFVAAPDYKEIERGCVDPEIYYSFENEKFKLSEKSSDMIRDLMKNKFGDLRSAAEELGLSEDFVYSNIRKRFVPYRRLQFLFESLNIGMDDIEVEELMLQNGETFTLPEKFDEDLMYLVGFVFGDGDISVSNERGLVRISNSNRNLLNQLKDIIKYKFGKEVEIEEQEDRVPYLRIYSKTIARFFENIGMVSPKEGLKLDHGLTTSKNARSFLKGLFEADGCVVSRDNGSDSIQYSTISSKLADQVQLMLETYGVKSKKRTRDRRGIETLENGKEIESKSVQKHLVIRGADIDRFAEEIGFASERKTNSLNKIKGEKRNANRDILPIKKILEESGVKGGKHSTYFNQNKNPGKEKSKQIIKDIELNQETENQIREVIESELKWEEVKKTQKTGKKELFDLTVPETHNFVGNGIITHNTAAVVRDETTGEFELEAGAVVLAHKGTAVIDEIDKMSEEDRSSLHEAMEQQQISVSKANIQATLNAQTSILAAGNPKFGRFDPYEPIPQQIEIGDTLLSRFDFIFPVKDEPDKDKDTKLSDQVLQNHIDPEETDAEIEQERLRKYVAYAKNNFRPQLRKDAADKIQEFYVSMRQKGGDEAGDSVPITARQLEALVRVAEASARAELKEEVEVEDAQRAIDILTYCLEQVGVDPETGEFDADIIETGTSSSQRNRAQTIKHILKQMAGESSVEMEEVLDEAEEEGLDRDKTEQRIKQLMRDGEVFEPEPGKVKMM